MEIKELVLLVEQLYFKHGALLVFVSSFIETSPLGFAIPGGLIVALGGFFSFENPISLAGILLSGAAGMLFTLVLAYLSGKYTGLKVLKKIGQEGGAKKAKLLLNKHGASILTTSLMANLTRFLIAFVAGSQRYSFLRFFFYALVASLTWNSLLVSIGYLAGVERRQLESSLSQIGMVAWLFLIVALFVLYWKVRKEFLNGDKR